MRYREDLGAKLRHRGGPSTGTQISKRSALVPAASGIRAPLIDPQQVEPASVAPRSSDHPRAKIRHGHELDESSARSPAESNGYQLRVTMIDGEPQRAKTDRRASPGRLGPVEFLALIWGTSKDSTGLHPAPNCQ
jgi:hypothetical protein